MIQTQTISAGSHVLPFRRQTASSTSLISYQSLILRPSAVKSVGHRWKLTLPKLLPIHVTSTCISPSPIVLRILIRPCSSNRGPFAVGLSGTCLPDSALPAIVAFSLSRARLPKITTDFPPPPQQSIRTDTKVTSTTVSLQRFCSLPPDSLPLSGPLFCRLPTMSTYLWYTFSWSSLRKSFAPW